MTILPPPPSHEEVSKFLSKWDKLEDYVSQESSLKKLFTQTYPRNVDMDDVLTKVSSLNAFYSTNIRYLFTVAKHIVDLQIDQRLANKDLSLVNEIAPVQITTLKGEVKTIDYYSFATKYCSHHFPENYAIYDSYIVKMLMHFKKKDQFYIFNETDLRNHPVYHNILLHFKNFFGLEKFSMKELDKYLWQAGKEYFSKEKTTKSKPRA